MSIHTWDVFRTTTIADLREWNHGQREISGMVGYIGAEESWEGGTFRFLVTIDGRRVRIVLDSKKLLLLAQRAMGNQQLYATDNGMVAELLAEDDD